MANVSEFSIVTYLRKPGHRRAAIVPKARIGGLRVSAARRCVAL
jgi:hypothetical protein